MYVSALISETQNYVNPGAILMKKSRCYKISNNNNNNNNKFTTIALGGVEMYLKLTGSALIAAGAKCYEDTEERTVGPGRLGQSMLGRSGEVRFHTPRC